ncbi:MAG: HAD-IC family P-type ATPase, partial [Proteobacteria bacterium]|nr:HAD-IC family P-type ATPase [Pseudomonadota bacterium]
MQVNRLQVVAPSEKSLATLGLHLAHVTPGRSRFHLAILIHNPKLCRAIEHRLNRDDAFISVKARPQTGSLVLEYLRSKPVNQDLLKASILEVLADPNRFHSQEKPGSTAASAAIESDDLIKWCTLSPKGVLKELQSDESKGLVLSDIDRRRRLYGSNDLEQAKPTSHWAIFKRQFGNSQTLLLVGSAGLSLLTGGIFDVVMIGGVILLNGYIGYLSEAHAEEVICSIGHIEAQEIRVLRDGHFLSIFDRELVVGDIVSLSHGVVPADMRILNAKGLMVDESPLTGESMPVAKHSAAIDMSKLHALSDRRNLLFRGTIITSGQGLGIVIGTGERTEIGRVRRLVASAEQLESPLQKDLQDIGRQTIWVSGAICGAVFFLGLLRGSGWMQMLQTSISLAVAAVPEGLPTIGTTTMALGVDNLKKQNILVRRLNVLETLGSIEVLCLDKTGTLTMNEMLAEEAYFCNEHWLNPHSTEIKKLKKARDFQIP